MEYLIGALVGSVIGYITNWLAIKMLFRPHEEKRFLGVKVPFTPGLIPKERTRIAKSVGEAVGTHLLTEKQLISKFTSDAMVKEIDNWLGKELSIAATNEKTVKEKIQELVKDKYLTLKDSCENLIVNKILTYIRTAEFKEKLTIYIVEKISMLMKKSPKDLIENQLYSKGKEKLISALIKIKDSEETSELIQKLIQNMINPIITNDRPLKEVLKEEVVDSIKTLIVNNSKPMSQELKKVLNEEDTKAEIKILVNKVVASQLNPMVAMFVNSDSISEKLFVFINEELEKSESQIKIAHYVCKFIDKGLDLSPSKIAYEIDKNLSQTTKNGVIKNIQNIILSSENIEILIGNIEEIILKKDRIEELLGDKTEEFISSLIDVIRGFIDTALESDEIEIKAREIIAEVVRNIEEIKVSTIVNNISEEARASVIFYIREFLITLVKEKGETALQTVNLSKIVEENINSFDVDYAEKIIIDIAEKELNAITWLGALLGAIMGLLSPVINSFM